eukprot:1986582-Rhodomonas_salina.1
MSLSIIIIICDTGTLCQAVARYNAKVDKLKADIEKETQSGKRGWRVWVFEREREREGGRERGMCGLEGGAGRRPLQAGPCFTEKQAVYVAEASRPSLVLTDMS